MKKLLLSLFMIVSAIGMVMGLSLPTETSYAALANKEALTYVSLGDSICAGTYITNSGNFTYDNNYTNLLYTHIASNEYPIVSVSNFGKDGDNTVNFLSKITGLDASGHALTGEALELSQNIQNKIKSADLVTISMGANDILGPANANLMNFLLLGTDITPALDGGLSMFITNFPKIITRLEELNPSARYIFTNIYNPYLELMTATEDITLQSAYGPLPVAKEKIQALGTISEAYINSSSSSVFPITPVLVGTANKNIEKGVNQLLDEYLAGKPNFSYINTKGAFDAYFASEGNYSVVNCKLLQYSGKGDVNFSEILDPHPTETGHAVMAELFASLISEKLAFVEFDFNGANSTTSNNIEIFDKNSKLTENDFPKLERTGYGFIGWRMSPSYTTNWTEDVELSSSMTFRAEWMKEHVVLFDTKGGSLVATEKVLDGHKVTKPSVNPTKTDAVFVGWFCDFGGTTLPWNFENAVDKDVTIYAKWAYTTCEGELSQKADNTQRLSFETVNGEGQTFQWVINKEPQDGATSSTFFFTAPEVANKTYDIYCLINGQKTNSHILYVGYVTPANIEISMIASSDNTYRFALVNTENINTDKCVWYKQVGNEVVEVGKGVSCEIESKESFEVFVEYDGNSTIKSNLVPVVKEKDNSMFAYIGLGGFVLVASIVIFIFVVKYSKKPKVEED